MPSAPYNLNIGPDARPAAGRFVVWLLVLLLSWQLIATTQHRHDLFKPDAGCASCLVVSHLPSGPPAMDLRPVALSPAFFIYRVAIHAGDSLIRPVSYLIPPAHAPPAFSLDH